MSKTSVTDDATTAQAQTTATTPPDAADRDQLILDPEALFNKILEWQASGYHVLSPATRVQRFAPNWGASVSMVLMNPEVDYETGRGTDCYFDPGQMKKNGPVDKHERGISRVGLARITRCAGISWDPQFSVRVDTRTIMHLWEFRAIGVGMDFDGQPFNLQGTKEVDFRDGSAQIGGWTPDLWKQELADAQANRRKVQTINGWSDRRVLQARAHGLQLCETKAMERATRTLGLQHVYTVGQLHKPFVVVKACYLPDLRDPEIRAMVADAHLRGTRALFAPQQSVRPVPVIDITPKALPEPLPTRDQIIDEVSRTPRATVPAQESKPDDRRSAPSQTVPQNTSQPAGDAHAVSGVGPADQSARAAVSGTAPATAPPSTPGAKLPGWRRSVAILDVRTLKEGTGKQGRWVLSRIELGIGESETEAHTTLDDTIAQRAREFRHTGDFADVLVTEDGNYMNVTEIEAAGSMPSLFDDDTPPPSTSRPSTDAAPLGAKDLKW